MIEIKREERFSDRQEQRNTCKNKDLYEHKDTDHYKERNR